jgi:membrane-associated phospholipid phosphatase
MSASELPAAAPSVPLTAVAASARRAHGTASDRWVHVRERLRACFWLKAVGTPTFMLLFFVGYFYLLRHPALPAVEMPLTAIDRWIGFQPWALWPYVSLWLYVVLPPALMPNARELIRYGWWIGGLCVTGLACFYLWPTAVPRQAVDTAEHSGFELLRGVDAAGNACPSLHVAAATFSALWLDRQLRDLALPRWLRGASAVWFALIVWSTLAIKQHVWWDVVAGLLLALVVALPALHRGGGRGRGDIMAP